MSTLFAVIWLLLLSTSESWKQDDLYYEVPCSTSEHSINITDTNKTVVFAECENGVFNLTALFKISKVSNLHITGDGASVIQCNGVRGMIFKAIANLTLENLVVQNCHDPDSNGSIHIMDCTDVTIKNVTIENSKATGLILEDNAGEIIVENCIFQNNGHGNNDKSKLFTERGGGLRVLVGGNVSKSSVFIKTCKILNNSAQNGGGLYVLIQPNAQGNNVTIQKSTFTGNYGHNGGGGLQISYSNENIKAVIKNKVTVQDCIFSSNIAYYYGGGTAVSSNIGSHAFSMNKIEFINCSWTNNTAELGMAVDIAIAPGEIYTRVGLLPSPVFVDCKFSNHKQLQKTIVRRPKSVLSVTGFQLKFMGHISFTKNNVTALEATSAELNFTADSSVEFIKNQGVNGGAMKLNGLTVMLIQDNSIFYFRENTAKTGGAIYVQLYKHSLSPSESCFIQYKAPGEKQQLPKNVSFVFINNTAGYSYKDKATDTIYRGDSIYATTFAPCLLKPLSQVLSPVLNVSDALKCIGDFSFVEPNERQISTAAHHFKHSDTNSHDDQMCQVFIDKRFRIHKNQNYTERKYYYPFRGQLHFVPGKVRELQLKLIDELCAEAFFHVSVEVLPNSKSISVDPAYTVITNNSIVLHGQPGDSGTIQLSTVDVRNIAIPIQVILDECPPGYILHGDIHNDVTCICSASCPKDDYNGITRCDEGQFQAYTRHGYWIGYLDNFTNSSYLTSAICPGGFCINITHWLWNGIVLEKGSALERALCPKGFCNFSITQPLEHLLPPNSTADISRYICHPNRNGTICGACRTGHSTFYRSKYFSCKPEGLCYLGWLFYILTELLPVTILFLVVIFFNISFTSGQLNGVVFFMQVVDTMKLDAENFIIVHSSVLTFSQVYKLIYRVFTLSIFAVEEFSFCLWQGASALDMLAFRYVTIVYSLFLVLTTIFLLKVCSCQRVRARRLVNLKRSIIHGLSAFLVMSYSECTRVSLMILTKSTVTVGPKGEQHFESRAFYNGDYSHMGPEHLKSAIPAIFFILTMVSIPPLLLLSYPLCYKLFALLRIEESRFVQITCKIFPLEKIKPLFDSMQGTFKDQYRFFAGLYFLYRLCILITFTYTKTLKSYYTITGIQLVCILVLHAVCRPYKKTWHNILDALLFANLTIINVVTSYNYQLTSAIEYSVDIKNNTGVQAALVLLPLVYLVVYTTYHIVKRIKAACACKSQIHKTIDDSNEVIDNLDTRDFDDSLVEMNNYMLLGPEPRIK